MTRPDALHHILLADNAYSVASAAHRRAIAAARAADVSGALNDEAHSVFMMHLNIAAREILTSSEDVDRLREMGRTIGLLYTDTEPDNARMVSSAVGPVVERVLVAAGRILAASLDAEAVVSPREVYPSQDAHVSWGTAAANQDPMTVPLDELGIEAIGIVRQPGSMRVVVTVRGHGFSSTVELVAASVSAAVTVAVRDWIARRALGDK